MNHLRSNSHQLLLEVFTLRAIRLSYKNIKNSSKMTVAIAIFLNITVIKVFPTCKFRNPHFKINGESRLKNAEMSGLIQETLFLNLMDKDAHNISTKTCKRFPKYSFLTD